MERFQNVFSNVSKAHTQAHSLHSYNWHLKAFSGKCAFLGQYSMSYVSEPRLVHQKTLFVVNVVCRSFPYVYETLIV